MPPSSFNFMIRKSTYLLRQLLFPYYHNFNPTYFHGLLTINRREFSSNGSKMPSAKGPQQNVNRAALHGKSILIYCDSGDWEMAVNKWREMTAQGILLKPAYVNKIIYTCNKAKQLGVAKEVALGWLKAGGTSSSWHFISAAIKSCGSDNDWKAAMRLLEMVEKPNLHCYTAAMKVCGNARQWKMMEGLLQQMISEGKQPSAVTHSVMLNAYARGRRTKEIKEYIARLTPKGLVADKILYATVVKALCLADEWDAATSTLKEAKKKGIDVDRQVYIQAMDSLADAGNLVACEGVLQDMKDQAQVGQISKPCVRVYGAILKACANTAEWKKALLYLEEATKSGLDLNVVIFAKAMRACMRARKESVAMALVDEMLAQGITPNSCTWTTLATVEAPSEKHWQSETLQLIPYMKDLIDRIHVVNQTPPGYVYIMLQQAFTQNKGSQWEEALQCLRYAADDGLDKRELVKLYNITMNVCAEAGQRQEIIKLMNQMKNKDLKLDKISYSTLVKSFAADGMWEQAVGVLEEMRTNGIALDQAICNSLLNACAEAENLDAALTVFDELEYQGFKADEVTFGSLFKACVKIGDWQVALKLYHKMKRKKIQVDKPILNQLIKLFIDSNQRHASNEVFFDKLALKS